MNRDKLLIEADKSLFKKILDTVLRRKGTDFKKELGKAIHKAAIDFKKMGIEGEMIKTINTHTGMRITSLKDLERKLRVTESDESEGDKLNEGAFTEWWDAAKDNAFNALAFYPMLTMFLEFDKLIKGNPDASLRITLIYLVLWIMIIAGKITLKHIKVKRDEYQWQHIADGGGADELYK